MTVCEYIDSVLKERKISRRKLALMANIPPSSLQSAFERNNKLSLNMLVPILIALGLYEIDISEFGYNALETDKGQLMLVNTGLFQALESNEELIQTQSEIINNLKQANNEANKAAAIGNYIESLLGQKGQSLLNAFDKLNSDGQQIAVERVEELAEIPKYQKEKPQPEKPSEGE